jgi:hypothetical protein
MLAIDELRNLLSYDPISGILTWKVRKAIRSPIGMVAGSNNGKGYLKVSIGNKKYFVHRIAWALHYGVPPDVEIDHINGIGTDNRIDNLRLATRSENMRNTFIRKDNKSGYKGVKFISGYKWRAQAQVNGKKVTIGYYETAELARNAYLDFIARNHGQFANSGNGQLRRSLDGVDVIPPLAGSHPAAAVLRSDQALTFQPLDGIGVDRTVDAEMDDQQGIAPGLGHEDIFKHDFTTAGEVVSSESLHFEVKG